MAALTEPKKKTPARSTQRELVLEEFTPYRIVALGHALSGRLAKTYADENLTIPEWRVLAVVAQAERVAARDVVARTPMDKMTVSRAVASLEVKKIVCRVPSETDRRVSMLSLSADGRTLFDRVAKLALKFEDELIGNLSANEQRVFSEALAKLMIQASK